MDLKTVLELLALINAATPGIATLIATIRGPEGEPIEVTLDKADASFQDNLDRIAEWEAENP